MLSNFWLCLFKWNWPYETVSAIRLDASMSVGQYVSKSLNSFSQKYLIRFFLNFLWSYGLKGQKPMKPNISESLFWEKSKNFFKIGFFGLCQKFNLLMFFYPKMILQKPNLWRKSGSSFMAWNALNESHYQYLLKESIDILDFLHGDNHKKVVTSETTSFGWVWPVLILVQSDCKIL